MCFAPQRRALFRHLNLQKWSEPLVFLTFWLGNVLRANNGVHFFDISSAKSGPHLVCFVHFDLEMCFAPQRRALFRHLKCQKWSAPGVFCAFWLGNVLRATKACTFSTSQLPKVLRAPGVLYILTCKCASRHNGVQFFISHLASWLRTRRFSEPTFRPSGAPNHWKNTVFRDFPTFSRICIFFLLTLLSSNLLSSDLSLLSASALLCFSSVHIVGSLTSKLPSTTTLHYTTLHCTTLQLQLHYLTLDYTTLYRYHTTLHNTTRHYTARRYTMQLHRTTTATATALATPLITLIPVVPHKAVAEVSKIGHL